MPMHSAAALVCYESLITASKLAVLKQHFTLLNQKSIFSTFMNIHEMFDGRFFVEQQISFIRRTRHP